MGAAPLRLGMGGPRVLLGTGCPDPPSSWPQPPPGPGSETPEGEDWPEAQGPAACPVVAGWTSVQVCLLVVTEGVLSLLWERRAPPEA